MDSRITTGRPPLAGLIVLVAALGCGGGRTARPVTAANPGTTPASAVTIPADVAFDLGLEALISGLGALRG